LKAKGQRKKRGNVEFMGRPDNEWKTIENISLGGPKHKEHQKPT